MFAQRDSRHKAGRKLLPWPFKMQTNYNDTISIAHKLRKRLPSYVELSNLY